MDKSERSNLKDILATLKATQERKRRLQKKLSAIGRQLRYDDSIAEIKLQEYLEVNESLRGVRIYEAQLCWLKNRMV